MKRERSARKRERKVIYRKMENGRGIRRKGKGEKRGERRNKGERKDKRPCNVGRRQVCGYIGVLHASFPSNIPSSPPPS